MSWWFSSSKNTSDQDRKALASQEALVNAATGTMQLAKDITVALRDRLDDYVSQINGMTNLINDALFLVKDNGIVETVNIAAENIFGYDSNSLIGSHISKIFQLEYDPKETRPYMERLLEQLDLFDPKLGYESFKGVAKDKHELFVDVSVTKLDRTDGSRFYLILVRDVSQRVIEQRNLFESEQHFRAFGEASNEAMMVHDRRRVIDWNDRLLEITGLTDVEMAKINPLDIVHPISKESVIAFNAVDQAQQYEALFVGKKGEVVEVVVNSKAIKWQGEKAHIKVIRDISVYKDLEKILRGSRERYKTIIDNSIDLVCCYDTNFEITFCNQTFWEYFDLSLKEILGQSLLNFIPAEDHEELKSTTSILTVDKPVRRCLHRVLGVDEFRWHDWIDRALFDDMGNIVEYQSVSRDVTDYINKIKT